MRRLSQVLEASFHCVTFWNHPGLPARPSAATIRSIADDPASRRFRRPDPVSQLRIQVPLCSGRAQRVGCPPARPPKLGFTPATAVEGSRSEETALSHTSCSSHIFCLTITLSLRRSHATGCMRVCLRWWRPGGGCSRETLLRVCLRFRKTVF